MLQKFLRASSIRAPVHPCARENAADRRTSWSQRGGGTPSLQHKDAFLGDAVPSWLQEQSIQGVKWLRFEERFAAR